MKKFLTVVLFALGLVVALAAPTYAVAQEDAILTDYDYSRLSFGNAFANQKAKPILRNADRAIHAPVSTLALLASIEYGARYQGMMINVDTGLYFYDATDCPGGSTSPTAVAPDDTVGCWYLMSGAADIWAALADTTPTSGASLIGIKDTATYYTGTTVETALAEVGAKFLTKQDLAVPAAIGNIATLDATGQVIDSGDLLSEYALLVGTPTNGNLVCTDALGQPTDCGSAPADYLTVVAATSAFDSAGLGVPMVDAALAGADVPVAPADGYRVFVTAAGGAFVEGKTYQYTVGTGYTGGVSLDDGYILQVKGTTPDFIIGGTALTDWVRLSDFATDLNTRVTTIVDTAADTAPADPGIDGYRVFMTNTDGGLDEGKIYVWDDTGNVWDAGTQLADGQIVASKGSSPDMIVGGTGPTDYDSLSEKLDRNSLACKDITVALSTNTGTVAADPDWIDAYYLSASPVSGADKVVASVVIAGDGAITVTLAAASTAEAVYRVCAILD
jgi:hypothetical protein